MKSDLDKAQQRAIQYWNIDGTMELTFGLICLLLALYFFAQATLPQESLLYKILDVGFVLVILGSGFVANSLARKIKERITYPRTGYVAYRQKSGLNRWVRMGIAAGISMLIAVLTVVLITSTNLGLVWMPAVSGMVFGLVMVILAYRVALLRFYLLAAISVLIGGGLALAGIGDLRGLAIFYGLESLALLVSGGATFWGYLKHTRSEIES